MQMIINTYYLNDFIETSDSDSTPAFERCFKVASQTGGRIVIEPGDYLISRTVPLSSGLDITAFGARLYFPQKPLQPHMCMFMGDNIAGFIWRGGSFCGYVYDPK